MTTLEGLAIEFIVVEILARLPAKTLIRFKSVCKSFNSIISSRYFVRLYLRHQSLSSSAADKRLILAGDNGINCYHLDPHATTTTTSAFVYGERSPLMSVIGTSNGLLCISQCRANACEYWILNPTTRIYRHMSHIHTVNEQLIGGHNHGFGFDHENLDYKIVTVSEYEYYLNNSAMKMRITSVYSLNKNCWRVIEITFPTDALETIRKGGVLIDSKLLHWMFQARALGKYKIGCFDICKNKWTGDVLFPRFYYYPTCIRKRYLVDFGVVDECLFSTFKDRIDKRCRVWVMKEYGVQESWVILLSIPDFNCFQGNVINLVACCQSSDTVLVRQPCTSNFLWYNKVDGRVSEAKFDGAPNYWSLQACMCSRSLVHIPGGQLIEH